MRFAPVKPLGFPSLPPRENCCFPDPFPRLSVYFVTPPPREDKRGKGQNTIHPPPSGTPPPKPEYRRDLKPPKGDRKNTGD